MSFLHQHLFGDAVALFWIYSAAVSAMPAPTDKSGGGYQWLYSFLHTIAGNLTTAFASKVPAILNGSNVKNFPQTK